MGVAKSKNLFPQINWVVINNNSLIYNQLILIGHQI